MAALIGIDLGTTNSVVALRDEQGRVRALPNAEAKTITPSAIWFSPDGPVVGSQALEYRLDGDGTVAELFKRRMGEDAYRFSLNDRHYSAIDLSAMVLGELRRQAMTATGETDFEAVITVPAYFRNAERQATIQAGQRAGLTVLGVINEPTAAAYAFLEKQPPSPTQNLIVYDLGGGTFDVTLLRIQGGEGSVLSSSGDSTLGGSDWDERIFDFIVSSFQREHGIDLRKDREASADTRNRAEQAKRALSSLDSTQITVSYAKRSGRYRLDRNTFNDMAADLMGRTVAFTRQVLANQNLSPSTVDGVVLVGGSSRMRMVHDFVRDEFGQVALQGVNVDEAVAIGAAIRAGELSQRRGGITEAVAGKTAGISLLQDVTNHTLGMIAVSEDYSRYVNSFILQKNQPIPCTNTKPFELTTTRGQENTLEIFLTQGESSAPGGVSYLGRYVATGIAHQDGKPASISVSYSYNASGTVDVSARMADSDVPLTIAVEAVPADVPARFLGAPPKRPVRVPITIYLAFDLSGSMSGEPIAAAKRAAASFAENCDLNVDQIGIIAFSDRATIKLQPVHSLGSLRQALDSLSVGETGGGNQGHPFNEALSDLGKREGRRVMVTLADGQWSNQPVALQCANLCKAAGIELISIGFGSADHAFLKAISSSDEAGFFTSMHRLEETFSTIAQVIGGSSNLTMADAQQRLRGR